MGLKNEEVRWVAKLARLSLTTDEEKLYADQLSAVLDYVSELKKLDITDVADVGQITGLTNRAAPDEVKNCGLSRDELLKNAPLSENGYVKVKSVLGRET